MCVGRGLSSHPVVALNVGSRGDIARGVGEGGFVVTPTSLLAVLLLARLNVSKPLGTRDVPCGVLGGEGLRRYLAAAPRVSFFLCVGGTSCVRAMPVGETRTSV